MDAKLNQRPRPKKPYSQPTLRVYGGIQDVTKASSNPGSMSDTRFGMMDNRTS
jgi:hypothetical protein